MDQIDMDPLLEGLEENIDDLEEALTPLLNARTSTIASKLPLLDKAKLHVLTAYAIESLLFSTLQLNGVSAKDHAIFTELTRLKQYFAKIKEAETGPEQRRMKLDKGAAGRFIKHGLSGNDRFDAERAERARGGRVQGHIKFDQAKEHSQQEQISKKRKVDEGDGLVNEEDDSSSDEDEDEEESGEAVQSTAIQADQPDSTQATPSKKRKKKNKTNKKRRKSEQSAEGASEQQADDKPAKEHKKKNKKVKKQSRIVTAGQNAKSSARNQKEENVIPKKAKSSTAPKGHSEAFQALLKRADDGKKGKKGQSND